MTRAPCARQMTGSSPEASSDEALAALGPVWTALMVAMGWPQAWRRATLCSTTASVVAWRWTAVVNGDRSCT